MEWGWGSEVEFEGCGQVEAGMKGVGTRDGLRGAAEGMESEWV